ncbi:unnamed protein product [Brassica rapa subsp. trilocularis]
MQNMSASTEPVEKEDDEDMPNPAQQTSELRSQISQRVLSLDDPNK